MRKYFRKNFFLYIIWNLIIFGLCLFMDGILSSENPEWVTIENYSILPGVGYEFEGYSDEPNYSSNLLQFTYEVRQILWILNPIFGLALEGLPYLLMRFGLQVNKESGIGYFKRLSKVIIFSTPVVFLIQIAISIFS